MNDHVCVTRPGKKKCFICKKYTDGFSKVLTRCFTCKHTVGEHHVTYLDGESVTECRGGGGCDCPHYVGQRSSGPARRVNAALNDVRDRLTREAKANG